MKKKSALKARSGRVREDVFQRLLMPVLMGVAIVASLVFGYHLYVSVTESLVKGKLEALSLRMHGELVAAVDQQKKTLRGIAARPSVEKAIRSQDVAEMDRVAEQLSREFHDYIRVRLVGPAIEMLSEEAFPGLGYGALDMMADAKKSDQPPLAEVHLYGSNDAHINFLHSLKSKGQVLGFVLVSREPEYFTRVFHGPFVDGGYVELRQGTGLWSDVVLGQSGYSLFQEDANPRALTVPGSLLRIGTRYNPLFSLMSERRLAILIPGFGFGLLLATAVFWSRSRAAQRLMERVVASRVADKGQTLAQAAAESVAEDQKKEQGAEEIRAKLSKNQSKSARSAESKKIDLQPEIFRAYDIRGVVGKSLSVGVTRLIGQSIGSEALDRGQQTVIVGRDGRHSGVQLSAALVDGLKDAGVDVVDVGAVPTGVLYFATHKLDTQSGVMVTGSHNPPEYNGFKIVIAGDTLSGDEITALYERIESGRLANGAGGVQEMDIRQEYIDTIADDVQMEEPLRVVVDAGSGIAGELGPEVLAEIGCEVMPLFCEVDGDFPHHHPDPSDPENLQDLITTVKRVEADMGIAFDGDGDRLGVVTRHGEIIYPDRLLMLFAEDVLSRNPGATIIYDIKCTSHLAGAVLSHGGSPIMWKTGHSFIKAKMKQAHALLAGEMSGHFFFKERWFGFDDGIYAAARLLEILGARGEPPEDVFAALPNSVSTPEIKVEMEEGKHYEFLNEFREKSRFDQARITSIDGVRADFDKGWGLVRCSNTMPCLVLRFEAEDEDVLNEIMDQFRKNLLAVDSDLELPF